jgi:hypothetical protein
LVGAWSVPITRILYRLLHAERESRTLDVV